MAAIGPRLSAGRLVYLFYFKPIGIARRSVQEGGPCAQYLTWRHRVAMEQAVLRLPRRDESANGLKEQPIYMLTGRRFWYQTAFCLWSLQHHSDNCIFAPIFYDDGSLGSYQGKLQAAFPRARFIGEKDARARLDRELPASKFPLLRERWLTYPNIRKLIDPHIGSAGWKLVLDSDILFFREPTAILNWLALPESPLHMLDVEESYGYDRGLLSRLAGAEVGKRLNVGVCGLRSDAIDWEEVEHWVGVLHRHVGSSYYLEQALVAMLVAKGAVAVLPSSDYITLPSEAEAANPFGVMHHYVSLSKKEYFRTAWRVCLDRMAVTSAG